MLVHDSALYGSYFDVISSQLNSSVTVSADVLFHAEAGELDPGCDEYSVLIVRGVELLKDTTVGTLGQLRARVHKAVECGLDVCLVSCVSRESFPSEPGSAILFEVPRMCCSHAFLRPLIRIALRDSQRSTRTQPATSGPCSLRR